MDFAPVSILHGVPETNRPLFVVGGRKPPTQRLIFLGHPAHPAILISLDTHLIFVSAPWAAAPAPGPASLSRAAWTRSRRRRTSSPTPSPSPASRRAVSQWSARPVTIVGSSPRPRHGAGVTRDLVLYSSQPPSSSNEIMLLWCNHLQIYYTSELHMKLFTWSHFRLI